MAEQSSTNVAAQIKVDPKSQTSGTNLPSKKSQWASSVVPTPQQVADRELCTRATLVSLNKNDSKGALKIACRIQDPARRQTAFDAIAENAIMRHEDVSAVFLECAGTKEDAQIKKQLQDCAAAAKAKTAGDKNGVKEDTKSASQTKPSQTAFREESFPHFAWPF